jgi:hypothetical protein
MGVGIGSPPMRCGSAMKKIYWSFTGLMTETLYIERCSGQALQTRIQCASFRLDVGRRQGLSENIASWELTLLPEGSPGLTHIKSLSTELAALA